MVTSLESSLSYAEGPGAERPILQGGCEGHHQARLTATRGEPWGTGCTLSVFPCPAGVLRAPGFQKGKPRPSVYICISSAPDSLCPQCRCRPGFRLKDDGRTCADVDECSTTFPCSQLCINTHGSYKCLCVEGYAPRGGDPHSCKAVTGKTGKTGTWRVGDGPGSRGERAWGGVAEDGLLERP